MKFNLHQYIWYVIIIFKFIEKKTQRASHIFLNTESPTESDLDRDVIIFWQKMAKKRIRFLSLAEERKDDFERWFIGIKKRAEIRACFRFHYSNGRLFSNLLSLSPSPFVQNFITGKKPLSMARARRFSLFSLNLPAAPNERWFWFESDLKCEINWISNKRHCQDFIYSSARESADCWIQKCPP